jgi:hypothetical protein
MTQRLILLAPKKEAELLNAALELAGFGPGNLHIPFRGNELVEEGQPFTHLGCSWFVTSQEEFDRIEAIVTEHAPHAVRRNDPVQDNGMELVKEVIRDHVLIQHKQFPNGKWGWSAKIVTEDPAFDPRVRSVWIYADDKHRQYKYTTGAFTLQNGEWVTEWNEQRDGKADVHWVVSWATTPEVEGSLLADEEADVAYIRFGNPIDPTKPPTTIEWAPGQQVRVGDIRTWLGITYTCRQAHTTQVGWEPPKVLALWLPT